MKDDFWNTSFLFLKNKLLSFFEKKATRVATWRQNFRYKEVALLMRQPYSLFLCGPVPLARAVSFGKVSSKDNWC